MPKPTDVSVLTGTSKPKRFKVNMITTDELDIQGRDAERRKSYMGVKINVLRDAHRSRVWHVSDPWVCIWPEAMQRVMVVVKPYIRRPKAAGNTRATDVCTPIK